MKPRMRFYTILFGAALLLQACSGLSSEAAIQTGVAQTLQIAELQTAAAGGGQAQDTATPVVAASATTEPSATLSATPSVPLVSVGQNTNCRSGPSSHYTLLTTIQTGQSVEVLKIFNGSNYVVVRNPAGSGDCWLWLQYATPSNFAEWNLPLATQPPTPTPTLTPTPAFSWVGAWNIKAINGGSTYDGPMNCTVSGNALNCSVTLNPGAFNYTFVGTISASLQTVNGTYSGAGSGDWQGQIKSGNLNQFVGNLDAGLWEFCGWRSGSSAPAPCEWP